MKTRITALFGIEHPLVCPGMTYVSTPELVAAVSNAGGLGILATGPLDAEATRSAIRRVRALTDKPFGVGVALIMPGARENTEVALAERVPVINFSLGKGDWICERAHAYGGKVIATVVNRRHALAAVKMGVDALLVTGHEAAAHGGEVTSLVLIPAIRSVTDLPLIATGGFASGGGVVAALALGADAVAMGTRFASTQESPVHSRTKALIVSKTEADTIYSSNFDSMGCRVMRTPAAEKATARKLTLWVAAWRGLRAALAMKRSLIAIFLDVFRQGPVKALELAYFGAATEQIRLAIQDGDHVRGVQLIGQVQGLIADVPTATEVVQRVLAEAEQALASVQAQLRA